MVYSEWWVDFPRVFIQENEETHTELRFTKVLAVKEEIQNNNDIYLLFFIIEVVNIAENMNFSENYVEESKNNSSYVDYTICVNSS